MKINSTKLVGIFAIYLVVLAGCGPVDEQARRKQAQKMLAGLRLSVDLNGTAIPDVEVGERMLETTGNDVNGKPINLSDYRGRVILLSFWGGG